MLQKVQTSKQSALALPRPEEVADLAAFLASDISSHIMGSGIRLDAGMDALC